MFSDEIDFGAIFSLSTDDLLDFIVVSHLLASRNLKKHFWNGENWETRTRVWR